MKAAFLSSSLIVPKGTAAPSVLANARPGYRDQTSTAADERNDALSRRVLSRVSAAVSDEEAVAAENMGTEDAAARQDMAPVQSTADEFTCSPDRERPCTESGSQSDSTPAEMENLAATLPRLDRTGRVKLSLRLTPERHLRLKLVAAHRRQSVQKLMLEALDAHIQSLAPGVMQGECACLERMVRERNSSAEMQAIGNAHPFDALKNS